jgi:hypothetical protein
MPSASEQAKRSSIRFNQCANCYKYSVNNVFSPWYSNTFERVSLFQIPNSFGGRLPIASGTRGNSIGTHGKRLTV